MHWSGTPFPSPTINVTTSSGILQGPRRLTRAVARQSPTVARRRSADDGAVRSPHAIKTLDAAVSYAIWVARHLSAGQSDLTLPGGLDAIPEVRDTLDAHLDRDRYPVLRRRSFFGRSLPKLAVLDPAWTERSLPEIFPADESSTECVSGRMARLHRLLEPSLFQPSFRLLRPTTNGRLTTSKTRPARNASLSTRTGASRGI